MAPGRGPQQAELDDRQRAAASAIGLVVASQALLAQGLADEPQQQARDALAPAALGEPKAEPDLVIFQVAKGLLDLYPPRLSISRRALARSAAALDSKVWSKIHARMTELDPRCKPDRGASCEKDARIIRFIAYGAAACGFTY